MTCPVPHPIRNGIRHTAAAFPDLALTVIAAWLWIASPYTLWARIGFTAALLALYALAHAADTKATEDPETPAGTTGEDTTA